MTKEERKKYHQQYYRKNKDKFKQYFAENRNRINAKVNEINQRHREANDETYIKNKQRNKQYIFNNKDKCSDRSKNYYIRNKEQLLEKNKAYRRNNKERIKLQLQKYYADPEVYKRVREKDRAYSRKRAQEIKLGIRSRPTLTLHDRIKHNLRTRLLFLLKKSNVKKSVSAMQLLGCSIKLFKCHIESQFTPGMNWDNHGIHKTNGPRMWHLDHIIPCSAFNLEDLNQQKKCFHYTNLRPFWGLENIKKGGIKKSR
jgi:hypothetical protein